MWAEGGGGGAMTNSVKSLGKVHDSDIYLLIVL